MNKELLEILLQFFATKPESEISKGMCEAVCNLCSDVECVYCIAGRASPNSFNYAHAKLDQIQITLKVITDEP